MSEDLEIPQTTDEDTSELSQTEEEAEEVEEVDEIDEIRAITNQKFDQLDSCKTTKFKRGKDPTNRLIGEILQIAEDSLLDKFDRLTIRTDSLTVFPVFKKIRTVYKLINSDELFKDYKTYKKNKLKALKITNLFKYDDIHHVYSFILGNLRSEYTKEEVCHIYMWYAMYMPEQAYLSIKDIDKTKIVEFWRFLLYMYAQKSTFQTVTYDDFEELKKPNPSDMTLKISDNPVVDKFVRYSNSYFYCLYIGYNNGKNLYKMGKSNREGEPIGRMEEHAKKPHYIDFDIVMFCRCHNESTMEIFSKQQIRDHAIPFYKESEIYDLSNRKVYSEYFVNMFGYQEFSAENATHKMIELRNKFEIALSDNVMLEEALQKRDATIQAKDEEIALLKKQLALASKRK